MKTVQLLRAAWSCADCPCGEKAFAFLPFEAALVQSITSCLPVMHWCMEHDSIFLIMTLQILHGPLPLSSPGWTTSILSGYSHRVCALTTCQLCASSLNLHLFLVWWFGSFSEEIFHNMQPKPLLLQLETISSLSSYVSTVFQIDFKRYHTGQGRVLSSVRFSCCGKKEDDTWWQERSNLLSERHPFWLQVLLRLAGFNPLSKSSRPLRLRCKPFALFWRLSSFE